MEVKFGAAARLSLAGRAERETQTAETEVAKDFEKLFLGTVVREVMNTVGGEAIGGGYQLQMWKSFFSDAIAEELALRGDVGVARSIQNLLGAYDQKGKG